MHAVVCFVDYLTTAKRLLSLNSPLLVTSPDVAKKYFSGSQKRKLSFAKLGTEPQFLNRSLSAETGTSQRQKTLWKLQGKVVSHSLSLDLLVENSQNTFIKAIVRQILLYFL